MVKFQEAEARKFRNIFVCKKCSSKVRANNMKIVAGRVKCRRCHSHGFRSVRKK